MPITILDAIKDENLFRPFLGDKQGTWKTWKTALRTLYGIPVKSAAGRKAVRRCTGRKLQSADGYQTALFLTGRRSGKSRVAALIGAFEGVLAGHESKLSRGERGVVAIVAPSKRQGRIVRDYLRAIFKAPMLAEEVASETKEGFELTNGTLIEIQAGDYRTVRGFTLLAAIIDEAAFFGMDADSRIKSDTELVRALMPGLATVNGRLIAITSPYAKKGWCFQTYGKHFGKDKAKTLVWNCPSRVMNPKLRQSVVDDALAEDFQAARSEYLGQFREDVSAFLPVELIQRLVVEGRYELLPSTDLQFKAFVDVSGGRGDDATLAIGHLLVANEVGRLNREQSRTVVVDLLRRYRPPFNPHAVIGLMSEEIKRFHIRKVTGDNYAAEFVARAFQANGLLYERCLKAKSALYAELLPRLCSSEIELLDEPVLVAQLASLERKTRSGGKDVIDHPPGGHDDLANVVAGVSDSLAARRIRVGGIDRSR